jgi:hypothetical protein
VNDEQLRKSSIRRLGLAFPANWNPERAAEYERLVRSFDPQCVEDAVTRANSTLKGPFAPSPEWLINVMMEPIRVERAARARERYDEMMDRMEREHERKLLG